MVDLARLVRVAGAGRTASLVSQVKKAIQGGVGTMGRGDHVVVVASRVAPVGRADPAGVGHQAVINTQASEERMGLEALRATPASLATTARTGRRGRTDHQAKTDRTVPRATPASLDGTVRSVNPAHLERMVGVVGRVVQGGVGRQALMGTTVILVLQAQRVRMGPRGRRASQACQVRAAVTASPASLAQMDRRATTAHQAIPAHLAGLAFSYCNYCRNFRATQSYDGS